MCQLVFYSFILCVLITVIFGQAVWVCVFPLYVTMHSTYGEYLEGIVVFFSVHPMFHQKDLIIYTFLFFFHHHMWRLFFNCHPTDMAVHCTQVYNRVEISTLLWAHTPFDLYGLHVSVLPSQSSVAIFPGIHNEFWKYIFNDGHLLLHLARNGSLVCSNQQACCIPHTTS